MRYVIITQLLLLVVNCLSAQEQRLPQKEARRYAKFCIDQTGAPFTGQITVDVNGEQPCAELGEGGGAMVIPDKKLSKKTLQKVGEDIVPIGQLWLRKWTLVVDGKAVPKKKLRMLTIHIDDKDRPMPLFLLGVRKVKSGLELVVFAAGSKPLQTLPLRKLGVLQDLPLEIQWNRGDKQIDTLTLNILGRYQAELKTTRQ